MTKTKSTKKIEMEDAILDYLEARDCASFPALVRALRKQGHEVDGRQSIATAHNVVIWYGVSVIFADAICKMLMREWILGRILNDVRDHKGKGLSLPIAKRPPRGGYSQPHWLPVYLSIHPVQYGLPYQED